MTTALQKDSKAYTSTDNSNWNLLPTRGIDLERGPIKADVSQHGDTAARALKSLEEFKGTLEIFWDESNTACGQINTVTEPGGGGTGLLYIKVLPDGTHGASCQCWLGAPKYPSKQGSEALVVTVNFEPGGGAAPTAV